MRYKPLQLHSFHMRRPKQGGGLLYILETKGSRRLVHCISKGRHGIDTGYLPKKWILENTVEVLLTEQDERDFMVEIKDIVKAASENS